jgi:hypothetical protein
VPESPQSLYTICRLYIKEDILCSNQDPNPNRKGQKRPPNVGSVTPATAHCSLLSDISRALSPFKQLLSPMDHSSQPPPPLARPAPALWPAGGQRPLRGSSPRSKPSIHGKRPMPSSSMTKLPCAHHSSWLSSLGEQQPLPARELAVGTP